MKAQHEGFIPYELFQEVQEILNGKKYSPVRKDYSGDFPLRGFIVCAHCNNLMTASWSKGRKKATPTTSVVTENVQFLTMRPLVKLKKIFLPTHSILSLKALLQTSNQTKKCLHLLKQ